MELGGRRVTAYVDNVPNRGSESFYVDSTVPPPHTLRELCLSNFAEEDEPARYIGGSNGHTAKINQALWGPCNTHIFSVSDDKTVRVWEVESESEVECITDHSKAVTSIEFSADKQMFITASSDHSARVR